MQDQFSEALTSTLNALSIVGQEVRALLTEFGQMKSITSLLVEKYRDGLEDIANNTARDNIYNIQVASTVSEKKHFVANHIQAIFQRRA
jgi:predicted transcriptional regulator YdeE